MVAAGTALLALGVLGITASSSLFAILACAFLAGAGQGTIDISTNVLVPAVYGSGAISALNVLHFAFGAGAVLSPILTSAALAAFGTPMPVLWLGAAVGLATALAALRWVMNVHPPVAEAHPAETRGLYLRPALWLLSLLMFLYVGMEMGVGGWTTVYAGRTTALAPGAIAWLTSGYWLALTGGRVLGAAAGARLSAHALARAAIAGTCLGGLMLLAGTGSVWWTVAGTVILGISFGPVFPTAVGLGNELFRDAPSRAVSVIIATSSLGGMVLPPLQGLLLERVSPRASVALVAAGCLGMLGLLFATERARPGRG
jgi:fucose permease